MSEPLQNDKAVATHCNIKLGRLWSTAKHHVGRTLGRSAVLRRDFLGDLGFRQSRHRAPFTPESADLAPKPPLNGCYTFAHCLQAIIEAGVVQFLTWVPQWKGAASLETVTSWVCIRLQLGFASVYSYEGLRRSYFGVCAQSASCS